MGDEPGARFDAALGAVVPRGTLFAVGGRVRDEIRTMIDGVPRPAKDLDYVVTGLTLADLLARLRTLGRTDLVGASFAVAKLTLDGTTVDVALPRRERSTGVGHRDFAVESGPEVSLGDDLARRDFRMNMLARAVPSGDLVDPHGGEADIRARRIDLLRPEAFAEDPLRMLRAAQFAARFDFALTPATLAALRAAAPLVASVSPERVRDELVKLLAAPRPSVGLELLREGGLLEALLPELSEGVGVAQNAYHAFDVYRHGLATVDATPPGDLVLRLAALLHDVGKPRTRTVDGPETHFYDHENVGAAMARDVLERLRFPGETIDRVSRLVRHHMYATAPEQTAATIRRFIRRIGPELVERQFALREADIVGSGLPKRGDANERFEARVRGELATAPRLSVKDLAVDGHDVIRLANAAEAEFGRAIPRARRGEVLAAVLDAVIESPDLDRAAQMAIAEAWLRSHA